MLETAFTCPNGHGFTANAKLRARCPTCGALARKAFGTAAPAPAPVTTDDEEPPKPKPASIKKPLMLRQGREMPRKPAAPKTPVKPTSKPAAKKPVAKKPTAKVSGGLVSATRVKRGITPSVRRAPKRTAPARHVVGESKGVGGYLQDMMRRAGF